MARGAQVWRSRNSPHEKSKMIADHIYVMPRASLSIDSLCDTQTMHSHRSAEFIVSLDGPIVMHVKDKNPIYADSFFVPPMCAHALSSHNGRAARLNLNLGNCSAKTWLKKPIVLETTATDELRLLVSHLFTTRPHYGLATQILSTWGNTFIDFMGIHTPLDARVSEAWKHIQSKGHDLVERKIMATRTGLSPSRFGAIFAKDTGTSLGRYIIWHRVNLALSLITQGKSITDAAIGAGFSDNSHLTRCCRNTCGHPPSKFLYSHVHYLGSELPQIELRNLLPIDFLQIWKLDAILY